MSEPKEDIKELIDKDEGLRSKRKMLTIISLILLSIEFSGAKVVEANTFILKLSFEHQSGIAILLLLATAFLLIRYYNYARLYHEKLYELWTSRLFNEDFYRTFNPYNDEVGGIVYEFVPKGLDVEQLAHGEHTYWGCRYRCSLFLRRCIVYDWCDGHQEYSTTVGLFTQVNFFKYIQILLYELKHRIVGFFTHRENLDIMAPYLLGSLAISSYFFNEKIQFFLNYLSTIQL